MPQTPLGVSLNPRKTTPSPTQLAAPVPSNSGLAGPSPMMSKVNGFMSDPSNKAFMMQVAASLLAQQGIMQSLSQGLGAKGRYSVADEQFKRRQAEDARRVGKGGGGGGGASLADKNNEKLKKDFARWQSYYSDLNVGDWTPDEVNGMAWMQAMRDNGDSAALEAYNSMDDADRAAMAGAYAAGPEGGNKLLQEWQRVQQEEAAKQPRPVANPSPEEAPKSGSGWGQGAGATGQSWGGFWPFTQ